MKRIIAHRGIYNKIIKENTYLAICNAIDSKYTVGVEFDVRLTKDNKIVVIHDKYINRTSNGCGIVEDMSLRELQMYNYGSNNFKQSIVTLDKILDIESSKIFLIEIKVNNNEIKIANVLNNILDKYRDKSIYITSFNKKVLKYINKNFKRGLISFTNNVFFYKYDFYVLNYFTYRQKTVNRLKKRNKEIFIFGLINIDVDEIDNLYIIKNIKEH